MDWFRATTVRLLRGIIVPVRGRNREHAPYEGGTTNMEKNGGAPCRTTYGGGSTYDP
jgi:hypothetical protein